MGYSAHTYIIDKILLNCYLEPCSYLICYPSTQHSTGAELTNKNMTHTKQYTIQSVSQFKKELLELLNSKLPRQMDHYHSQVHKRVGCC